MTIYFDWSRLERAGLCTAFAVALMACSPGGETESSNRMPMGGMESDMPMMRDMPEWMMSGTGMMGPEMMQDMRSIHGLLTSHEKIERRASSPMDSEVIIKTLIL